MYTPARIPGPLDVHHATPVSVRFTIGGRLPAVLARSGAVRDAKAKAARHGVARVAGVVLDESDIDTLAKAMRRAADQTAYDVAVEYAQEKTT